MAHMAKDKTKKAALNAEDAALEAELAAERSEKKQAGSRTLRTVLGGVCGTLVMLVILVALSLLFIRIPALVFIGTALLIWLFVWLFRGDTGKPLLWTAAVGTLVACVFGACLHAAGIFMVYGGLPLRYLPYVTSVIVTTRYFWGTFGDGALFAILFSILGFVVMWQFTGDPFPFWRGASEKAKASKKKKKARN